MVGVIVRVGVGVIVGVRVTVGVIVGVGVMVRVGVWVIVGVVVRVGAARLTVPETGQRLSNISDTVKVPSRPSSAGTLLKSACQRVVVPPPGAATLAV